MSLGHAQHGESWGHFGSKAEWKTRRDLLLAVTTLTHLPHGPLHQAIPAVDEEPHPCSISPTSSVFSLQLLGFRIFLILLQIELDLSYIYDYE